MKEEIRSGSIPPALVAVVLLVVIVIIGFVAYRSTRPATPSSSVGNLPPWEDPQYKGKLKPGQNPNDWHPASR